MKLQISLRSTSLGEFLDMTTCGVVLRTRYWLVSILVSISASHEHDFLTSEPRSTSGIIECNHRLGGHIGI